VTSVLTSPRTRNLRRGLAERRRRLSRQPHRVFYFHQLDDPYSHLAAQVLAPFIERYEVELVPMLVGPPPAAAAPERERLVVFSREDAAGIAPDYGLEFRDPGEQPGSALLSLAGRILAGALDGAVFASLAVRAGRALWSGDAQALEALAREHPPADESSAQSAIAAGDDHRRRLGHYLGGTFFYGGEWYWGIDRLHYLERRLADLGVRRAGMPNALVVAREERSTGEPASTGPALTLEFFVSLRSPYTAIAFSHVYDLVRRSGVKLVLRPVLPMVMRGLPVPRAKRLYIVLDTKREAERAGVAFGRVCDPVGRPVERAYSLYPWAREAAPRSICTASPARPSPRGSTWEPTPVWRVWWNVRACSGTRPSSTSTARAGATRSRPTARPCSRWASGESPASGSAGRRKRPTSAPGVRIASGESSRRSAGVLAEARQQRRRPSCAQIRSVPGGFPRMLLQELSVVFVRIAGDFPTESPAYWAVFLAPPISSERPWGCFTAQWNTLIFA